MTEAQLSRGFVHARLRPVASAGDVGVDARPATLVSRRLPMPLRSLHGKVATTTILLLVCSGVLSTVAIRGVLQVRLDRRVEGHLEQEVDEFQRLVTTGVDPATRRPLTSARAAFDAYLARNVPHDDEAVITYLDGRPYASDLSKWSVDRIPEALAVRLDAVAARGDTVTGVVETRHGPVWFEGRPVRIGATDGLFVVAALPMGELTEIHDLTTYGSAAVLVVLVIASLLAWVVVARLLRPIREVTATAELISESDLTRRITVDGSDEPAQMARSFNAMLDRLEAVFRAEHDFIRDASHELRVPLTVCLGNVGTLGGGIIDDPALRGQTAALVSDELERMGRIVEDLELLAEAEQPDFVQVERIVLADLARDLLAKVVPLAARRWQIDAAADDPVSADRQRVTQALMNLVDNAVHHTGVDDVVAIGTAVDDAEARIWVRDTGCGIDPAQHSAVFDRFHRGPGALERYRGSGLGLAIVQRIAHAHGGRVELRSLPGCGSTFTIVIPR